MEPWEEPEILSDPAAMKAAAKAAAAAREPSENATNYAIRLHRAISWYQRSLLLANLPESSREMTEARLILLWISLSSLLTRWDAEAGKPVQEGACLKPFIEDLDRMDPSGRLLVDFAGKSKAILRRLLTRDVTLDMEFWRNPANPAIALRAEKAEAFLKGQITRPLATALIREALLRIFVLRGQLVHGASTAGSKHNRAVLSDCLQFLQAFLPLAIAIVTQCPTGYKWPPLCYPPVDTGSKKDLDSLCKPAASGSFLASHPARNDG